MASTQLEARLMPEPDQAILGASGALQISISWIFIPWKQNHGIILSKFWSLELLEKHSDMISNCFYCYNGGGQLILK